jgi:hypothetical protein
MLVDRVDPRKKFLPRVNVGSDVDNSLPNSLQGDIMKEIHALYSVVDVCNSWRETLHNIQVLVL